MNVLTTGLVNLRSRCSLRLAMLLAVVVMSVGSVWGESVTLDLSHNPSFPFTNSPITIVSGDFSVTNGYVQIDPDESFTISASAATITRIVITYTEQNRSPLRSNNPCTITTDVYAWQCSNQSGSTYTTTWFGEAKSVVFSTSGKNNLRISQIYVEYDSWYMVITRDGGDPHIIPLTQTDVEFATGYASVAQAIPAGNYLFYLQKGETTYGPYDTYNSLVVDGAAMMMGDNSNNFRCTIASNGMYALRVQLNNSSLAGASLSVISVASASCTVTFDANGHGIAPESQTIDAGSAAAKPADPSANGWSFEGWYENAECTGSEWNFNNVVTANKTLYAKWTQLTNKTIYLKPNGDWLTAEAKFAIWDKTRSQWSGFMTQLTGCNNGIYSGEVANSSTEVIFVRIKSGGGLNWDDKWNQTVDLTISGDKFEIVSGSGNAYTGNWSTYTPKYQVVFDKNGYGDADPTPQCVTSGGKASTPVAPVASGRRVSGWYETVACSGTAWDFGSNTITTDKTLYAKWEYVAPTGVSIAGKAIICKGDNISLTATPTNALPTATYQWYFGQQQDGSDKQPIDGATEATYSKADAQLSDRGYYFCEVSNNGMSTFSPEYRIGMWGLRTNADEWLDGHVFERVSENVGQMRVWLSAELDGALKIFDGRAWYGRTEADYRISRSNRSFVGSISGGNNVLMTTEMAGYYLFEINYSDAANPKVTVTYPDANQQSGYTIYFDNSGRQWSSVYYRIGRTDYNTTSQMTLVPGTRQLYKLTLSEFNNFSAWHIGNNAGSSGSSQSVYNTINGSAITQSIPFQKYSIIRDMTFIPEVASGMGTDAGVNSNCQFYEVSTVLGMKSHHVSIMATQHGTITVAYKDVDAVDKSFTSGSRDLAHTCVLTISANAEDGYELSSLKVNDANHTSGGEYVLTDVINVSAVFTKTCVPQTYQIAAGSMSVKVVNGYWVAPGWANGAGTNPGTTVGSYRAVVTPAGGGESKVFSGEKDNTYMNFYGLTPNTEYTWTMQALGNETYCDGAPFAAGSFHTGLFLTTNPEDVSCSVGDVRSISVTLNSSYTSGCTYQWYSQSSYNAGNANIGGGTPISGATAATFTVPTSAAGTHYYYCRVSMSGNPSCYAVSTVSTVDVYAAGDCAVPTITAVSPAGLLTDVSGTETVMMSVTATGNRLTYQWYQCDHKGGNRIAMQGKTAATLALSPEEITVAGTSYYVCHVKSCDNESFATDSRIFTVNNQPAGPILRYNLTESSDAPYPVHPIYLSSTENNSGGDISNPGIAFVGTMSAVNDIHVGGMTAKITLPQSKGATNYVNFSFDIAEGKSLIITEVLLEILPVDYETTQYQTILTDANGSRTAGIMLRTAANQGNLMKFAYSDKVKLQGHMELRLYGWDPQHADAFARINKMVSIYGYIESLPSPDLEWETCPANGIGGKQMTILAECSNSSSAVTYSSSNPSVATVDASGTLRYVAAGKVKITASVQGDNVSSINESKSISRTIIVDDPTAVDPCTQPGITLVGMNDGYPVATRASFCAEEVDLGRAGSNYASWDGLTASDNTILQTNEHRLIQWFLGDAEVAIVEDAQQLTYKPTVAGMYRAVVTVYNVNDKKKTKTTAVRSVQVRLLSEPVKPVITGMSVVEQSQEVTLTARSSGANSYQWYIQEPGQARRAIDGATEQTYTWQTSGATPVGRYYFSCQSEASNSIVSPSDGASYSPCSQSEMSSSYNVDVVAYTGCEWHYIMSESDAETNDVEVCTHATMVNNSTGEPVEFDQGVWSTGTAILNDRVFTINNGTAFQNTLVTLTILPNRTGTMYALVHTEFGTAQPEYRINGGEWQPVTTVSTSWQLISIPIAKSASAQLYEFRTGDHVKIGMMVTSVCQDVSPECHEVIPTITVTNDGACASEGVTLTADHYAPDATLYWISGSGLVASGVNSINVNTSGSYWVRAVSAGGCTVESFIKTVTVGNLPTYDDAKSSIPAHLNAQKGARYTVSAHFENAEFYQWYYSTVNSTTIGTPITGKTSSDLTVDVAQTYQLGTFYFYCIASNACGRVASKIMEVEVINADYEECYESTKVDLPYVYVSTPNWNSSANKYELTSANPRLEITSEDGFYITQVKYTMTGDGANNQYDVEYSTKTDFSSTTKTTANADGTEQTKTYAFSLKTRGFALSLGSASGTRTISKLCITVEPTCTDPGLNFSGGDVVVTYQESYNDAPRTLTNANKVAVQYLSSDPRIATVDATGHLTHLAASNSAKATISATSIEQTISSKTYCEDYAAYQLTVSIPGGTDENLIPKVVKVGDPNACTGAQQLRVTKANGDAFTGSYTVKWYRDTLKVAELHDIDTYTATVQGLYTAVVKVSTPLLSSNYQAVAFAMETPEVTPLTKRHYYRLGCDYTAENDNPTRHLFRVKPCGSGHNGAVAVKPWEPSATLYSEGNSRELSGVSSWVVADTKDPNMVLLDMKALAVRLQSTSFLSLGDSVVIKVTPRNICNEYSPQFAKTITLYVTKKHVRTVAYIVSGGNKSTSVVAGDFYDINKYDLINHGAGASKTSWKSDFLTDEYMTPLYKYLRDCGNYVIDPVNGYASFNMYNYEPYDLILMTDFVKTDVKVGDANTSTYINDLAQLVDVKPMLTLKAHMAKAGLEAWQKKGFTAAPYTPYYTRTAMKAGCYTHAMFEALETPPTVGSPFVTITSQGGVEVVKGKDGTSRGKALQGFRESNLSSEFLPIATICVDGETESDKMSYLTTTNAEGTKVTDDITEPLVVCCERQKNLAARLLVLSVNAYATEFINLDGQKAIDVMLQYLLKTEEVNVSDCGFEFDNDHGTGVWSDPLNWSPSRKQLPLENVDVRILANCIVDIQTPNVRSVTIADDAQLSIIPSGALIVKNKVLQGKRGNSHPITNASLLVLGSTAVGNATLIHGDDVGTTKATVEMYSIANGALGTDDDTPNWQWIATPFGDSQRALNNYYNTWMTAWNNTSHEWSPIIHNEDPVMAFNAYCYTRESAGTQWMQGTLTPTADVEFNFLHSNEGKGAISMVGNSWTAPIIISQFRDEDFVNVYKQITMWNTGYDPEGDNMGWVYGDGDGSASDHREQGTYVTVPINVSEELAPGLRVIPSMQAFEVKTSGAGAVLRLNYNQLVRPESGTIVNTAMRAPGRSEIANEGVEEITDRLYISVKGQRYYDFAYVFENSACSDAFDDGWDGQKNWNDNYDIPQLFVETADGEWTISTQSQLVGTRFGFFRGEDLNYTMTFKYDGDDLWLHDTKTDQYTLVKTGNEYTFQSVSYSNEHRFILTNYNPYETPTGVDDVSADVPYAEKMLIEDQVVIRVGNRMFNSMGKTIR